MASSKAIADSGREGLPIKLKRTDLNYDNKVFSNLEETLNYGEPLYFNSDKTLVIGDSQATSVDNLPVVKFKPRNQADKETLTEFATESFDKSTTIYDKNNIVQFINDDLVIISDGKNIPKQHKVIKLFSNIKSQLLSYFDKRDNSGITRFRDQNDQILYSKEKNWPIVTINKDDTYYMINTNNISDISSIQQDSNSPGCYKITIEDMKSEYNPCASLYIPAASLSSNSTIRDLKNAYGRISQIQTFDNYIIVCFIKKPDTSFQLSFVGG